MGFLALVFPNNIYLTCELIAIFILLILKDLFPAHLPGDRPYTRDFYKNFILIDTSETIVISENLNPRKICDLYGIK